MYNERHSKRSQGPYRRTFRCRIKTLKHYPNAKNTAHKHQEARLAKNTQKKVLILKYGGGRKKTYKQQKFDF